MIKVYITQVGQSSKKVIQYFEENKIPYVTRNIIQNPLTESEIKVLLRLAPNGITGIISTRAKFIKTHAAHIEKLTIKDIYALIKTEPTILKRPIILEENRNRMQVGYNENEIELFLKNDVDNQVKSQFKIY